MAPTFAILAIILSSVLGAGFALLITNRFFRSVTEKGAADWRYAIAVLIVLPIFLATGFIVQDNLAAKLADNNAALQRLNALTYCVAFVLLCMFTATGRELVADVRRYTKRGK